MSNTVSISDRYANMAAMHNAYRAFIAGGASLGSSAHNEYKARRHVSHWESFPNSYLPHCVVLAKYFLKNVDTLTVDEKGSLISEVLRHGEGLL